MSHESKFDEAGGFNVVERQLGSETIVHDRERNLAIMRIAGILMLPVGAEIELTNPNINAVVRRVRLLAGTSYDPVVRVCLDVEVPESYYGS